MKQKINCLQYGSMIVMIIASSFVGIGVYSLVKATGVDAYLSILMALIIAIPLLLLFLYIANYEPNLSFPHKMEKLYGKKIGRIVNYLVMIFIFIFANNYMFNLTNFIVSQFLPETPIFVVGVVFAVIAIYANLLGIETISRTCLILLAINLLLLVIGVIGLLPEFQFSNLKPVLEFGIGRPLKATFYIITLNIMPMFALLIVPKNSVVDSKNFNRTISISYLIGLLITFTFCIMLLGVLGIYLASIYQYPEYILLKHVDLFGFLDRIENIIAAQWIFGLCFGITLAVYYIAHSIKPNHNSKLLPTVIVTLMLLVSIVLIPNNTAFNTYIYEVVPLLRVISLTIFIIIGISIFIKQKKNS